MPRNLQSSRVVQRLYIPYMAISFSAEGRILNVCNEENLFELEGQLMKSDHVLMMHFSKYLCSILPYICTL